MTTTVSDDIVEYLDDDVDDLTDGTNLFVNELPDTPDLAAMVRQYGGPPPVETMGLGDTAAVEVYGVQVTCRAEDTPTAEALAQEVWRSLHAATGSDITGLVKITPNQMPFPMGLDERQRVTYVCNYLVHLEPS